jgi:hypothetical protein
MLMSEPIVLLYSIYNAFTFSVLFAFFEAYLFVFMGEYDFSISQYGSTFLGIGGGVCLEAIGAVLVDLLVYQKIMCKDGERARESNLPFTELCRFLRACRSPSVMSLSSSQQHCTCLTSMVQ